MRKLKYIFIIFVSIAFLFACNESTDFSDDSSSGGDGGTTDDSIYSLDDAWEYFVNTNYGSATSEFNGLINEENSSSEDKKFASFGLGLISYINGNYNEAYSYFENGLGDDFSPDNAYFPDYEKYSCIGMLYVKAENTSGAQTVYSKYPVLKQIKVSWNFPYNNSDIELSGVNVHTLLAQMFVNMASGTDQKTINMGTGEVDSTTSNGYDDHFEFAAYHLYEVVGYCNNNNIELSSKALGLIDIVEQQLNITIN
jgi:hypothetical protein